MMAVTWQIVTCTTHGRTAGVKIILRITNLQKVVGGGGDRGKDDHNTGGEASKRGRAGQRGGETSGTGKGLKLTSIQGIQLLNVVMMMMPRWRGDDAT